MKTTYNGEVTKAGIRRELGFYPKAVNEIEDGYEVIGPKGINIKIEETDEENVYNVIDIAGGSDEDIDDIDLDIDDIDLEDDEDEKPAKKKPKKKVTKGAASSGKSTKETMKKPAKKSSLKDEVMTKVANGSIVNSKRFVIENIKLDNLAPTIELLKSTKLDVEVEFKNNNLTLVGEQAGLAAVYLLMNENK